MEKLEIMMLELVIRFWNRPRKKKCLRSTKLFAMSSWHTQNLICPSHVPSLATVKARYSARKVKNL